VCKPVRSRRDTTCQPLDPFRLAGFSSLHSSDWGIAMFDFCKVMVRLDEQDPRLNPLPSEFDEQGLDRILKRRRENVEMVLSILNIYDDNPIRIKARKTLEAINKRIDDLVINQL
jgi:hypothetical protein